MHQNQVKSLNPDIDTISAYLLADQLSKLQSSSSSSSDTATYFKLKYLEGASLEAVNYYAKNHLTTNHMIYIEGKYKLREIITFISELGRITSAGLSLVANGMEYEETYDLARLTLSNMIPTLRELNLIKNTKPKWKISKQPNL